MYFDLIFQDIKKNGDVELLLTLVHVFTEICQRNGKWIKKNKLCLCFSELKDNSLDLLSVHMRRESNQRLSERNR